MFAANDCDIQHSSSIDLEVEQEKPCTILLSEGHSEEDPKFDILVNDWSNSISERSFRPLCLIYQWHKLEALKKCIFVPISLHSGVEKDAFTVCVLPGGCRLELTISWRDQLVTVRNVNKNWLLDHCVHSKIQYPQIPDIWK